MKEKKPRLSLPWDFSKGTFAPAEGGFEFGALGSEGEAAGVFPRVDIVGWGTE